MNRIKGQGHQPLTLEIEKNWQRLFDVHPLAFDGLIYQPKEEDDTNSQVNGEIALFGQLDEKKETFSYHEPCKVSMIQLSEGDSFGYVNDDGDSLGFGENELFVCLLSTHTPKGAVIEYKEVIGDTYVVRWWYVLEIKQGQYRHFSNAKRYYCIPFSGFELE